MMLTGVRFVLLKYMSNPSLESQLEDRLLGTTLALKLMLVRVPEGN